MYISRIERVFTEHVALKVGFKNVVYAISMSCVTLMTLKADGFTRGLSNSHFQSSANSTSSCNSLKPCPDHTPCRNDHGWGKRL